MPDIPKMKLELQRKIGDYLDQIDDLTGSNEERRKILGTFLSPEPSLTAKARIFLNMYHEEFGEQETKTLINQLY
jgi:hypothetical protein